MQSPNFPITIIASDGAEAELISSGLSNLPGSSVSTHAGTLTSMNGTAIAMTRSEGIVITRLATDQIADLEAIERIAATPETRARLIVLSDPDMPMATARRLMKAGVADVLPAPADIDDLVKSVQRASRPAQLPAIWTGRPPSRVISITRARGGIGATTVAVNLADALAMKRGAFRSSARASVVVVDLDLQFGSVASFLDVPTRDTLQDISLEKRLPDMGYLESELQVAANGVHVLTAPSGFLPLDALSSEQVGALIEALRERYEYVIVDLPHSLVDWVQAVIERSDRMLVVTDTTVPSIRQSKRLVDFFRDESPSLQIDVVVNREAKPLLPAKHHTQAAKLLEQPLRTWLPNDQKTAREALDRGVPLAVTSRRSPLSRSIRLLAKTMVEGFTAPPKPAASKN